jgi:hypothetical protein
VSDDWFPLRCVWPFIPPCGDCTYCLANAEVEWLRAEVERLRAEVDQLNSALWKIREISDWEARRER